MISLTIDKQAVAIRLKEMRLARGWTMMETARRSGLTWPRIGHFERGRRFPVLISAIKLSRAFGITVEQLIFGDDANES